MINIRTVRAGREYRVRIGSAGYTFMLDADAGVVVIYTATAGLGGWNLERFGGALNPAGIRRFVVEYMRVDAPPAAGAAVA